MNLQDLRSSYQDFVKGLQRRNSAKSMEIAVGGEFEAIGILERELLIQQGLQPDGYLIDVGCGSGRLAKPLTEFLRGRYLGTDVVPELIEHARRLVNRPDWRFDVIAATTIPEKDAVADMVCFFSVFTHLLHEDSYRYLTEARRVLKPGGRIVFSFLEFKVPTHWSVFANNVSRAGGERPLDMFLSRDAITAWAEHLELRVEALYDGHLPHIALRTPVRMEDGTVQVELGRLGQSVGVFVKTP
jgi:SAM-dependent methyltransferase